MVTREELAHLEEVLIAAAPMVNDHCIQIPIAEYLRIVNPEMVLSLIAEIRRLDGRMSK